MKALDGIKHKVIFFVGINIRHLDFWLRTIEAKTLYISISNDFFECESEDAKHKFKMRVTKITNMLLQNSTMQLSNDTRMTLRFR